jgi:HK97 family phage prohead protease
MGIKTEERRFTSRKVEVRSESEDSKQIVGYGAVFESRSEDLGGFVEIIERGAFDDVLNDDVRALFNHDNNIILGRSMSGTLKLSVDDVGLRYEIDPPDTQMVRDMVLEPMRRGDVTQSSFGFYVGEDDWQEDRNGVVTRSIKSVDRLMDVSPVTYAAYPDTEVALRKLNAFTDKSSKFAAELASDDTDVLELIERAMNQLSNSNATLHIEVGKIMELALSELTEARVTIGRKNKAIELYERLSKLNPA